MAKKKAKAKTVEQYRIIKPSASAPAVEEVLFDLSEPDEFRKAFLAAEILNRKY